MSMAEKQPAEVQMNCGAAASKNDASENNSLRIRNEKPNGTLSPSVQARGAEATGVAAKSNAAIRLLQWLVHHTSGTRLLLALVEGSAIPSLPSRMALRLLFSMSTDSRDSIAALELSLIHI